MIQSQKLEEVIRGFVGDFESKVLVANELQRISQVLIAEANTEMEALEARILATRKLLNNESTTVAAPKAADVESCVVNQVNDSIADLKEEATEEIESRIEIFIDEIVVTDEQLAKVKEFEHTNLIEIENSKINGSFKYGRKKYFFTASNNMKFPMVYGAKSLELIAICKAAISKFVDSTFYDPEFCDYDSNVNHLDRYYNDIEREIMIYYAPDGSFKGYFQGKSFVWDPSKYELPTACGYKNSLDTSKYRKMKNVGQAELIKSLCEDLRKIASYLNGENATDALADVTTDVNASSKASASKNAVDAKSKIVADVPVDTDTKAKVDDSIIDDSTKAKADTSRKDDAAKKRASIQVEKSTIVEEQTEDSYYWDEEFASDPEWEYAEEIDF